MGVLFLSGLLYFCRLIDDLNTRVGHLVAWCVVYMVLMQFAVVILRYVFSMGFIAIVESIWYMHGMLFMIGAGYTLLKDGHVRVDLFYREAQPRTKAWVDLLGALVFLLPVVFLTFWYSWSYVVNSWRVFEISSEAGGLPFIYLYKTVILVFATLIGLQGISLAIKALAYLNGKSDQYSAAS